MGFRFSSLFTNTPVGALPSNGAETVLYQLAPLGLTQDSGAITVVWQLSLTLGTGGTGVQIYIRRGNTVGGIPLSASIWQQAGGGGKTYTFGAVYYDIFFSSLTQYCLTVTQFSQSTAATVLDGCLAAYFL